MGDKTVLIKSKEPPPTPSLIGGAFSPLLYYNCGNFAKVATSFDFDSG